jgi:hypothetical protein
MKDLTKRVERLEAQRRQATDTQGRDLDTAQLERERELYLNNAEFRRLIDESERIRGEAARRAREVGEPGAANTPDGDREFYLENAEYRALVDQAERIRVAAQQGDAGNATAEGGKLPT